MGPVEERELSDAAARDIMPMVYTPVGAALDRIAARLKRPVPIHVCVDTGLGRVGVPHRHAAELIRERLESGCLALRVVEEQYLCQTRLLRPTNDLHLPIDRRY